LPLDLGRLLNLLQVGLELRTLVITDQLIGQFGVGGYHHESRAEQRVRAGGECGDRLIAALDFEGDCRALRTSDPVSLHRQNPIGPARLQLIHVIEQSLRIVGDLEIPLIELAFGNRGAAPLALTIDDLFVRQHGLVFGAPVDERVFAVGQAPLEEAQEQPLRPSVVLGVAGVEFARPVEAQAVSLERRFLGLDVPIGPFRGMGVVANGGILGGQPEGVPTDRVQHFIPLHPPQPGKHIPHRVRLGMTHVQIA